MHMALDTSALSSALVEYERATGKELSEVLNRAGKNVAFRAMQFTKAATAAQIRRDLLGDNEHLLAALTSIRLKKQGIGLLKGPLFRQAMDATLAARIGHARYLRSVWSAAIEQFGGTMRGKRFAGAEAKVRKATVDSLLAEIIATVSEPGDAKAESAEARLFPALQEAIDFVAADISAYAHEKLQEAAGKAGL